MARYGKETRRTPAEVMDRARVFFGPQGVGLKVEEDSECCLHLSDGGGYVLVEIALGDGGRTSVNIETREWDYQVLEFLKTI